MSENMNSGAIMSYPASKPQTNTTLPSQEIDNPGRPSTKHRLDLNLLKKEVGQARWWGLQDYR